MGVEFFLWIWTLIFPIIVLEKGLIMKQFWITDPNWFSEFFFLKLTES
jgi:hypothetical protein